MAETRIRALQALHGYIPLLYVTGPPGIGKSFLIYTMLNEYTRLLQQSWAKQRNEDKDERRTIYDQKTGLYHFNPPWRVINGSASPNRFFIIMFNASRPGEIFFLDDPVLNTDTRGFLQSSATPPRWVEYNKSVRFDGIPMRGERPAFQMGAGVIVCINLRPGADREIRESLAGLMDRARIINFPWDRELLFEYVNRIAFIERGLMPFLRRKKSPDTSGLSFTGNEHEALSMLQDVQDFYVSHWEIIRIHSFRTVEHMLADRLALPRSWRGLWARGIRISH